jgi:hypothetical protein
MAHAGGARVWRQLQKLRGVRAGLLAEGVIGATGQQHNDD